MFGTDTRKRNAVKVLGNGTKTLVLAHGFGCDQSMWRLLTPHLLDQFKIVVFDYVGCGQSDPKAFRMQRYQTLDGYAQDIIDVCQDLEMRDVTLVGHSVSAMTGLIAALKAPDIITKLAMVCPSPCFLNDPPQYSGGFELEELEGLIGLMDQNYIGWANHLAPLVMGQSGAHMSEELSGSFCSTDPLFAKCFAKATFFSDCRDLLPKAEQPTFIFQSTEDTLAPVSVGEFIHSNMQNAELKLFEANGHCLHMTHPKEIAPSLIEFALK